ncbi:phage tail assembly protein [Turicimonas muris]|uniref:phage tail assembly protein n=1 Tax=Turicimonas muris TaxID=1796652 RepID=UPI001ED68D9F|nr:phage tail assembly protein [Turicimonas muris]MBS4847109.1 phage tail assembly protein [Burkholderiales bacterium]
METIKLIEPIDINGDTIEEIQLRRPDGKDIREFGFPYRFATDDGEIAINSKVCARYISRLGALPSSAVDRLSPADFQEICTKILGFFGQERPEKAS